MTGRGISGSALRLGCAMALGLSGGALAQTAPSPPLSSDPADPGDLDPSAPMAPLPELEVDWPDLDEPDATAPPTSTGQQESKRPIADASGERRYTLAVEGLATLANSTALLEDFRKRSTLETERRKTANAAQIGRRSQSDSDLLAEMLRSQGYYDAVVEPRIEQSGEVINVILGASPGVQYHFASVELPGLTTAGENAEKLRGAFAVKAGDPVIASQVIDAGTALTRALGEEGYAEAKIGEQDITVNHETHLASLVLPVDPGPVGRFGTIQVSGRPPFSARHIGVIARFKRGDIYRRSRVDDLRRALIATGLISNATITPVTVDGGRTIDLAVKLEPAPQHTIAGELGYGTGQGVRAEASWTDRNFINPEGALTLRGVIGTQEQLAAVQLRRSNFRARDQVLNLQALASHQKFDAYEARTVKLGANLERQSNFIWQKKWTWTAGGEILATDERGVFDDSGMKDTRTFLIAALPASLGYDGSDSLLDPTRGFRLSGILSPEISAHGGQFTYVRAQLDASTYRPVSDRVVLAGRVRFGTIVGADLFDIAPSRRFYSGGGGSVRGYGYQRLGPRDVDGDPIGGRGLAEFALEARIRLSQLGGNFGIVPFLDGGSLSRREVPDMGNWRFGAGLGLRYYSSFGPIRIDVGTPINRQKGDGIVAVTVSLGQAF